MREEKSQNKGVLISCMATGFLITFVGSALNLSIPDIGMSFQASAQNVGWVITCYVLFSSAFAVPFGKAADIVSRRPIYIWGNIIFSLGLLWSALAGSLGMLLVARAFTGFGAAMIFSSNIAILVCAYPANMRGKMLGLATASVYAGLSLGPVLGGICNHYVGWRGVLYVTFGVSIVSCLLAWLKTPKDGEGRRFHAKSFDFGGSFLFVAMLIAALVGFSSMESYRYWWIIALAGLVFGIAFVKWELSTENPVVKVGLFIKNPAYGRFNLVALLNYGSTFTTIYFASIYLQVVKGFSSQVAGIILLAQPLIMTILSPLSGRLSDKYSPYLFVRLGMIICAVALLGFSALSVDTPVWGLMGVLALTGVGTSIFGPPITNLVVSGVEKEDYGVATSMLATMRNIGQTVSMAIVTVVVGVYMGDLALNQATPQLLTRTMHGCFLIFAGVCAVGTLISSKRK